MSCTEDKDLWQIVLDASVFYPEGGGQPADTGILTKYRKLDQNDPLHISFIPYKDDGTGRNFLGLMSVRPTNDCIHDMKEQPEVPDFEVHVLDVHEKDGIIIHYCDAPLEPGTEVCGQIDWKRRFDHMQQHSGEHIVSGLICRHFNCDNVGFHMGKDVVTIDYNADISLEDLKPIEDEANAYIAEGHAFREGWYSGDKLSSIEYRSKKHIDGEVRITQFPGADCCACCGTHVRNSVEVRMVKFISAQRFTKGTRIELVCGNRAFDYLSANMEQNTAIAKAMATSFDKTYAIYMKQRKELAEAEIRAAELEKLYCAEKAKQFAKAGDVLLFEEHLSADGLRNLSQLISEASGGRCAVFEADDDNYKYAIAKQDEDIRPFVKEMNKALKGKGGGAASLAQGYVEAGADSIKTFFQG